MQAAQTPIPPVPNTPGGTGDGMVVPFVGFDPPESNFWRLPNEWFDLAARFTSWAEQKVVEYILRHTWGYHEYGMLKLITMDEFMHGRKRRDGSRIDAGCGMAENSIKKGLHDAVAHGFLVVRVDDSDKGRIRKYYGPRMRTAPTDEGAYALPSRGQSLPGQGQFLTPDPRALTLDQPPLTLQAADLIPTAQPLIPSRVGTDPRTEQTPPETHLEQDTDSNNTRVVVRRSSPHRRHDAREAGDLAGQPRRAIAAIATGQQHIISAPVRDRQRPERTAHAGPGTDSSTLPPDLADRLIAEGINPARARQLVASQPVERIERQLAWIDGRNYRDRAASLIAAIEGDFAPPPRRTRADEPAALDRSKYYRGSYALCPHCGCRPCAPGCAGQTDRVASHR